MVIRVVKAGMTAAVTATAKEVVTVVVMEAARVIEITSKGFIGGISCLTCASQTDANQRC